MCPVTKLSVYYSIFSIFVPQLKLWLNECYFGANFDVKSASKTVRLTQVMRAHLHALIEPASKWRRQEQLKRSLLSSRTWGTLKFKDFHRIIGDNLSHFPNLHFYRLKTLAENIGHVEDLPLRLIVHIGKASSFNIPCWVKIGYVVGAGNLCRFVHFLLGFYAMVNTYPV